MKAPALDLHRANRPNAVPGLLALGVAIVVLVATMQYLDTLKTQGEALDERESAIAQQESKFRLISNAHRNAGDARMADLMAQQRYATEPARALIEGGWNPGIALLSVDIATGARQINLQFETRSAQEGISYADWFRSQPGSDSVTIRRQVEKPGPPAPSVETSLQVTWRPLVAKPLAADGARTGAAAEASTATNAMTAAPSAPAPAPSAASAPPAPPPPSAASAHAHTPAPPPSAGRASGGRR